MKKYLKKLGVLLLIVAMLAPYVYIPEVEAETSTGCTTHLKQYMLLDASKLYGGTTGNWLERLASEDYGGYNTYTNFPFDFPSPDTEKVTINAVEVNELRGSSALDAFWQVYLENVRNVSSTKVLESYGQTFVNFYDSTKKYSEYDSVSVVFHGKWANDGWATKAQENDIFQDLSVTEAKNRSLQSLLSKNTSENNIVKKMDISLTNAKYLDYMNEFRGESHKIDVDYFGQLIKGVKFPDGHSKNIEDYVYYDEVSNQGYFTVRVKRKIGLTKDQITNQLNEYSFGEETSAGVYKIYTANSADTTPTNSYSSMKKGLAPVEFKDSAGNSVKPEIDINTQYFWPAILSVEYTSCPVAAAPVTTTTTTVATPNVTTTTTTTVATPNVDKYYKVEYKAVSDDVKSVSNLPKSHSEKVNVDTKVSSDVPTKEGFAFKGWCIGTEQCTDLVKANDKIKALDKEGTITLYAQWGKTGAGEQEKTGVMSYVLGLSAVALVAGGVYLVSKKKNLFKQI